MIAPLLARCLVVGGEKMTDGCQAKPGEILEGCLALELAPLPLNSTRCHGHCKPSPRYNSATSASHTYVDAGISGSTRVLTLVVSAPSTSTSTRAITAQFSTPSRVSRATPSGISRQITQPHTSVSQGDTTPPTAQNSRHPPPTQGLPPSSLEFGPISNCLRFWSACLRLLLLLLLRPGSSWRQSSEPHRRHCTRRHLVPPSGIWLPTPTHARLALPRTNRSRSHGPALVDISPPPPPPLPRTPLRPTRPRPRPR